MDEQAIKNLESQTRLAVSVLGIAFAEALLQAQPALEHPLKNAVLNWGRKMEGYGKGYEVAADSLKMLSRALHDPEVFPQKPA
jgi:hypothetical protein